MRLLVIKPSSFGDIVHGLQVVQSLKTQKPETKITWLSRREWAPLVQAAPFVDNVMIFDRYRYRSFFQLIKTLRKQTFDAVLDLQGLLRTGILTFFARSKTKIGTAQAREGSRFLHKTSAPFPTEQQPHAINFLLECLPLLGAKKEVFFPLQLEENPDNTSLNRVDMMDFWGKAWVNSFLQPHRSVESEHTSLGREEAASVSTRNHTGATPEKLQKQKNAKNQHDPKKYILIFPSSRQKRKEWPFFSELTQALLKQNVVVWSDSKPWDLSFESPHFINLTGKTSLEQVISLIKNAELVIANDSGPMQLAAALQTKVLALFGPTNPSYAGPFPLDNPRNCAIKKGDEMQDISVQEVIQAAEQLLA